METREQMEDKPVIVVIKVSNPMVFSEIEPRASSILIHMGVQDNALMDVISGKIRAFRPPALPNAGRHEARSRNNMRTYLVT